MGDILKDLGTTGIAKPDDVSTNFDYLEFGDESIVIRPKFGGIINIIPPASIDELVIEPRDNL